MLLCLCVVGAGGLAAYVKLFPAAAHVDRMVDKTDVVKQVDAPPTESQTQKPSKASSALKIPTLVNGELKLLGTPSDVADGVRPETALVNDTLVSLQIEGAKALGMEVTRHNAMIDFNPAIQKGYGTIEEGNLIKALQMALGQFPDIKSFQLRIDGKVVDTLGNIDLTTPVDVIRPSGFSAASSSETTPP